MATNTRKQTLAQIERERSLAVGTASVQRVEGLLGRGVGAQHVKKAGVVEHASALLVRAALVREDCLAVVLQLVSTLTAQHRSNE